LNGGAESSDAEFDGVLGGEHGVNFDEAVVGGEAFLLNSETIEAERKIASKDEAGIVGGERAAELDSVTGKFH